MCPGIVQRTDSASVYEYWKYNHVTANLKKKTFQYASFFFDYSGYKNERETIEKERNRQMAIG